MRDWFYWNPPWVFKRVVSLVVLGLVYTVFVLVGKAGYSLMDYMADWNWPHIAGGAAALALIAMNWYMVDDLIWD